MELEGALHKFNIKGLGNLRFGFLSLISGLGFYLSLFSAIFRYTNFLFALLFLVAEVVELLSGEVFEDLRGACE
jgi:hypothetical protein